MSRYQFYQPQKRYVRKSILFRNSHDEELDLKLLPHAHLMAITAGRGDDDAFCTLVFRILVGNSLTEFTDEEGRQQLQKEVFESALASLISVGERYQRTGKFGTSGEELGRLKDALNLTDQLQVATTRRQQLEMYQHVQGLVGSMQFTLNNLRKQKEKCPQ